MSSNLTAVSLFAGILTGGFDEALSRAGVHVAASVEIDPACRGVLRRHFPQAKIFSDVTEVSGEQLRAAGFVPGRGILTAGWPCQGNSVAGHGKGMADPRSGLWEQAVRILGETQPGWFIGENVPGLLSVNGGRDFKVVIDDLEKLQYVVSVDILDAQYFGVPQRRRRLFFVCQHVTHILRTKTPSSALTIAQCFTEILACILAAARQQSLTAYPSSTSARWLSADGLRKRMTLFGLDAGPTAWQQWLSLLGDAPARSPRELRASGSPSVSPGRNSLAVATSSPGGHLAHVRSLNTGLSWNDTWAAVSQTANSCITSTRTSRITESQIYSCATALLSISEHTARWTNSSPNYWSAASSVSTALKEYTNYARQAASSLFGEPDWVHEWADFIRQAERYEFLAGCLGDPCGPVEVLLEPEGGERDLAEGAATRAGPAGAPDSGTDGARTVGTLGTTGPGGGWRLGADEAAAGQLVASTLQGGGRRGHRVDAEGAAGGHLIAFDAAPMAFNPQSGGSKARIAYGDKPPALQASQVTGIQTEAAVRRLTPRECERLQGFPDDWTRWLDDGTEQSDSARYRQCGNAVAVPVAGWIARRVAAAELAAEAESAA